MNSKTFYSLMRPWALLGCWLGASCIYAQTPVESPLDEVVAVVNEEVITQRSLADRLSIAKKQLAKSTTLQQIPPDQLSEQVLQAMINEVVMKQFASNNGLAPSLRDIESALQAEIEASGKSRAAFEADIRAQGLTMPIFREQIRLQMIISQIRNQVIAPSIKIREAEIDAFLSERLGNTSKNPEVNVAHIVVKVPENPTAEQSAEAMEKIKKVLATLSEGAEFTDVAARYSDFSDARVGGLLGWRPRDRLPDVYQQAIKTLKIGQTSPSLQSANGYHVIKLIEERESAQQIVERIRARHILLRVDEKKSESQVIQDMDGLSKRLNAGEDFASLAKKYSQDGSAKQGGDLGWLYPGDTVAEFEQALSKLPVNQITPPIRSQFGWHIIQALARESVPLPEEKARQIAKRVLTDERMASEFRLWLDEQVARVYLKTPTFESP